MAIRRFDIAPNVLGRIWKPRNHTSTERDNMPLCARCTARMGYPCAIEAYKIVHMGDDKVEVAGRCRGVCHHPDQDPREPRNKAGSDNWTDVVRIQWKRFSSKKAEQLLNGTESEDKRFQNDFAKQVSAIVFWDQDKEDVT